VRSIRTDEGHERAVAACAADLADTSDLDTRDRARHRDGWRSGEEELVVLPTMECVVESGFGGVGLGEWVQR
jgi:hypothetical protein